jgi:signal transduction histidine kinase
MTAHTPIRTLPAFTRRDVQSLLLVAVTFSFLGGALQELHRAAGPSGLSLIVDQIGSNLVVSATTVAVAILGIIVTNFHGRIGPRVLVDAWREPSPVPMWSAVVGGLLGGFLAGLLFRQRIDIVLIVTSGLWMLMANILVRIVGNASRRIWQQAHDLQDSVYALQRSRVELVAADLEARRSIAEFLHGTIQSDLLSIDHQLQTGAVANARKRLQDFRTHVIRDISHRLHPLVIEVGLVPAIDELAASAPIPVRLNIDTKVLELDDFGGDALSMRTRLAVYRVIQEGILNCTTSAQATEATVSMDCADNALLVSIVDNGIGLHASPAHGVGLQSVDAWVAGLGGSWRLESNPGGGARLSATIPIGPTHDRTTSFVNPDVQ